MMSMALKSAAPFWEDVLTGQYALVKGIGDVERLPLCKVYLKLEFVEKLPHEGVNFLLCNDIAGDRWGRNIIVCSKPLKADPVECEFRDNSVISCLCSNQK